MADVRDSLRSVNELLKTFDRLIMELDDVSAILSINVRTGKGELIESGTIMQQEQTNNGSPFWMRYLEGGRKSATTC